MSDDADYEPVVLTGGEAPPAAPPAQALPSAPTEDLEENQPRGQRVLSDKTRSAFKALVAKHADGPLEDDLVPVDTAAVTPAPAVAAAPAVTAAVAVPAPVAAAPAHAVEQPAAAADIAARAMEQQRTLAAEAREKALADRETQLSEREKTLPTRDSLVEDSVGTFETWAKATLGLSDEEYKDYAADFISEMTSRQLKTPLDPTLRTGIESRKAVRAVKTYKSDTQRREEALKAEQAKLVENAAKDREARETEANEGRARAQLRGLLDPFAKDYKYLFGNHDGAAPEDVVFHQLKQQRALHVKQHGEEDAQRNFKVDWPGAAKLVNDYYEAIAKKYQSLLAPTPAPAAAPVKPSPQVSAQVQRSTTPAPEATPQTEAAPEPESSDWRAERNARRRSSLTKNFGRATPNE